VRKGVSFPETNRLVAEAGIMARYHQPYSEIEKIPLRTLLFMMRLAEAEDKYSQDMMKKNKMKMKGKR